MRNPFKDHTIQITLTEYQLELLIRTLAASNPSGGDEATIVILHVQLSEILRKIQE